MNQRLHETHIRNQDIRNELQIYYTNVKIVDCNNKCGERVERMSETKFANLILNYRPIGKRWLAELRKRWVDSWRRDRSLTYTLEMMLITNICQNISFSLEFFYLSIPSFHLVKSVFLSPQTVLNQCYCNVIPRWQRHIARCISTLYVKSCQISDFIHSWLLKHQVQMSLICCPNLRFRTLKWCY